MAIILYEESFSQTLGYGWVGCNESEVGGGGRGAVQGQQRGRGNEESKGRKSRVKEEGTNEERKLVEKTEG